MNKFREITDDEWDAFPSSDTFITEFGTNQKTRFIMACERKEEKQKYTYTVSLNGGDEVEVIAERCYIENSYLNMYMGERIVACFKNWDFLIEEPLDEYEDDEEDDEDDDTCCGFCDC